MSEGLPEIFEISEKQLNALFRDFWTFSGLSF
jgi:hypothetical protein